MSVAASHPVLRPRAAAMLESPLGVVRAAAATVLPFAATVGSIFLYSVACPPYEWAIAAWIAPGLLLVPTRDLSAARRFACGLLFGALFGFWITRWTYHATLAYFGSDGLRAGTFVLVMWLGYAGVPYGLLLVAYGAVARRVAPRWRATAGAWLLVASEWLRSTMLTGLPWELLGDTQFRQLPFIQIADLGGVYLVSFLVALVSIALAESARDCVRGARGRALATGLVVPAAALIAGAAYGVLALRVHAVAPERLASSDGRTVAVIQARVPTSFRWKRAFFQRTIGTYGALTRSASREPLDLIVWPENAANFYLADEPLLAAQLGAVAATSTNGLLVGGPRLGSDGLARNSAYLLTDGGRIRDVYDKRRLVPFAEYDPFRAIRPHGSSDDPDTYVPGDEVRPIVGASMTLGTMICYEALFPHLVRELVRRGADVLVNVSNDAWLDAGDGVAPKQHFSHVVFRAIENRRYMVRASDSGMSGFVAPTGAIYAVVPHGEEGAASGRVVPLHGRTLYGACGDAWIAAAGLVLAAGLRRRTVRV